MSPEYLAGFFDGEGCIKLYHKPRRAVVCLAQSGDNGKTLFQAIQDKYGGLFYQTIKAGEGKATKDGFQMYWNKDVAILLLQQIIPHLRIKKDSAQEVLNYLMRKEQQT